MTTSCWRSWTANAALLGALVFSPRAGADTALDTAKIEQLSGAKGTLDATEGVFKVSVPRPDLAVTVAGVKMVPALGLTSWAAFQAAGAQTMVMGDMVLQEDQVAPVMDAALNNGLEVTGLHNHFLADSPKVMFMHIGGMGDQEALATAVGKVFATIRETSGGKGRLPVLIGALAYGASIALYIRAAQQLGAVRSQAIFASAPFIGAGLSYSLLGEPLAPSAMVAALLMVVSASLLFGGIHAHRHAHLPLEHIHSHRHDDDHHDHDHGNLATTVPHSHRHRHEDLVHAHPHWPDLHHRHDH